jgi:hypothetical protein
MKDTSHKKGTPQQFDSWIKIKNAYFPPEADILKKIRASDHMKGIDLSLFASHTDW